MSFGPEYGKIDHEGVRNTVSTNQVNVVAKERGSNVYITSDSRINAATTL